MSSEQLRCLFLFLIVVRGGRREDISDMWDISDTNKNHKVQTQKKNDNDYILLVKLKYRKKSI